MNRLILFIFFILGICADVGAQMLKDSVLINFRQSKVYLDTAYMDNPAALRHAREMIEYYHRPDSNFELINVTVEGGASPEGSVKFNEWLSRERAARIFDYMGSHFNLRDSITHFTFYGRDWKGLRRMVSEDPKVPFQEETLATLDEIIEIYSRGEAEDQGLLTRIKRVKGGAPYRYMYEKLFPTLRASKMVLTFDNPHYYEPIVWGDLPELVFNPEVKIPLLQIIPVPPVKFPDPDKPFYMDISTNLLFDALAIPNVAVEFYLGKNFSLNTEWMYGWWKTDKRHRYWRAYGGDVDLRWWFGNKAHEKPLTGHHLGVYGGIVTYDFEWGGKGYMGGLPGGTLWDKYNWYAGVEYGYSLPVARRFNIDFTIGIGYLTGEYRIYEPVDNCYVWKETHVRKWVGPTKAEISLVWLLGRGNCNSGKGGKI